MENSDEKLQASRHILNPSDASIASEQTAINAAVEWSSIRSEKKWQQAYPSPPNSASPRQQRFSGVEASWTSRSSSFHRQSSEIPTSTTSASTAGGDDRGSLTTGQILADDPYRPLNFIRHESKKAHRAPHLQKRHQVGADIIDQLDVAGGGYHHDGPFDATYLARNTSFLTSPLEAVADSNEAALKATPREKILDSIRHHRPLDGVAITPPGLPDAFGRVLQYEEGTDLLIESRRQPGIEYHPDDRKGKGEPSFTLERALTEHKKLTRKHRRYRSDSGNQDIELLTRHQRVHASVTLLRPRSAESASDEAMLHLPQTSRIRASSGSEARPASQVQSYAEWESDSRRRNSKRDGNILTRKFANLGKARETPLRG